MIWPDQKRGHVAVSRREEKNVRSKCLVLCRLCCIVKSFIGGQNKHKNTREKYSVFVRTALFVSLLRWKMKGCVLCPSCLIRFFFISFYFFGGVQERGRDVRKGWRVWWYCTFITAYLFGYTILKLDGIVAYLAQSNQSMGRLFDLDGWGLWENNCDTTTAQCSSNSTVVVALSPVCVWFCFLSSASRWAASVWLFFLCLLLLVSKTALLLSQYDKQFVCWRWKTLQHVLLGSLTHARYVATKNMDVDTQDYWQNTDFWVWYDVAQ